MLLAGHMRIVCPVPIFRSNQLYRWKSSYVRPVAGKMQQTKLRVFRPNSIDLKQMHHRIKPSHGPVARVIRLARFAISLEKRCGCGLVRRKHSKQILGKIEAADDSRGKKVTFRISSSRKQVRMPCQFSITPRIWPSYSGNSECPLFPRVCRLYRDGKSSARFPCPFFPRTRSV
jgi:hypothetical protein